jgi:hypothetical protein
VKNLILQALFQSTQEKKEGSGSGSGSGDPDLYLSLIDPDQGGQKTCGSGSPTEYGTGPHKKMKKSGKLTVSRINKNKRKETRLQK